MSRKPFSPLRFDELPETPRKPHRFFEIPSQHVELDSEPFGPHRVHLREYGAGPPLLLVHGLMTTGYSWRYVTESLGDRYRLFIPDMVGCGRSDKPDRRYDPDSLAIWLGELQRAVGIRGCRVVGNSLGGYLCMRLAMRDPQSMSALVNIHSPAVSMPRLHALESALAIPGSQRLFHLLVGRDPLRWAHSRVHYWDETLKSLEEAHEYGDPLATHEGREGFRRYLAHTLAVRGFAEFVEHLREHGFPIPLRLVYARVDPMVPPVAGERLAELVPEADMVWLDEASHFSQVDCPELTVETIHAFFERQA